MYTADQILALLCESSPMKLEDLPDEHGIYALWDHTGWIRYIGCTSKSSEGFRKRIYGRHTTGSEDYSHKFSHFYNVGRMWRDTNNLSTAGESEIADAKIAKKLRAEFIRTYCGATVVSIPRDTLADDTAYAERVRQFERDVHALAPAVMRSWEPRSCPREEEPVGLVDAILATRPGWVAACDRQARRWKAKYQRQPSTPKSVVGLLAKLVKLYEDGHLELEEFTTLKKILHDPVV